MSQVYVAVRADIVDNLEEVAAQTEAVIDFLHSLPPADGVHGVHVPGENLQETRRRNLKEGIPVTEITWQRILEAAERGRRGLPYGWPCSCSRLLSSICLRAGPGMR